MLQVNCRPAPKLVPAVLSRSRRHQFGPAAPAGKSRPQHSTAAWLLAAHRRRERSMKEVGPADNNMGDSNKAAARSNMDKLDNGGATDRRKQARRRTRGARGPAQQTAVGRWRGVPWEASRTLDGG